MKPSAFGRGALLRSPVGCRIPPDYLAVSDLSYKEIAPGLVPFGNAEGVRMAAGEGRYDALRASVFDVGQLRLSHGKSVGVPADGRCFPGYSGRGRGFDLRLVDGYCMSVPGIA